MSRRAQIRLVLLVTLGALALAGCGGSGKVGSGTPETTTTPARSQPATQPTAPTPPPTETTPPPAPSPPPAPPPTNPETISRSTFKGTWPFTVDSGVLACDTANQSVTFAAGGVTYGLNGTALDHGYPNVTPIWTPSRDGLRVYLGDVLDAGLALCGT